MLPLFTVYESTKMSSVGPDGLEPLLRRDQIYSLAAVSKRLSVPKNRMVFLIKPKINF